MSAYVSMRRSTQWVVRICGSADQDITHETYILGTQYEVTGEGAIKSVQRIQGSVHYNISVCTSPHGRSVPFSLNQAPTWSQKEVGKDKEGVSNDCETPGMRGFGKFYPWTAGFVCGGGGAAGPW